MGKRWGVWKLMTAVAAMTAMLAALPAAARAADRNWVGGSYEYGYEMWYLDNNWQDEELNSGIPLAGDIVYITNPDSQAAFNALTPSLGYMQIDNSSALTFVGFGNLTAAWTDVGFNADGTINMGWGSHTVNGDLRLGVNSGSQGNYNMGSGNLSSTNEFVGNEGTGVFLQTGGINHVDLELIVGRFAGSNGTYELSGGELETYRENRG